MSENIRGITFAEQTVTPADDAIVRRAILGDGILAGCDISYSGSTLTMAPGYIIACGRAFQVTAAKNWAVVDATSGVARLLLTLDMTKTSTEETFSQINFSIEYASAEDGFVDLIQDDINISGVKYQIVAAVVSLGTGGITGIVSKLEKTEGGGGLNFKVVPGLTQPGAVAENTIWVKTEKIPVWTFSVTEPENPVEGMVWFLTGTSSATAFNALKRNTLQVYPISAKEYVGEAWVDVNAMSYQGGKWNPWAIILFSSGALTNAYGTLGNPNKYNMATSHSSRCTTTVSAEEELIITWNPNTTGSYASPMCYFEEPFDFTNISEIEITTGSFVNLPDGATLSVIGTPKDGAEKVAEVSITADSTQKLDVSMVQGKYYLCVRMYTASSKSSHAVAIKDWRMTL